jgi:hypothetical protein
MRALIRLVVALRLHLRHLVLLRACILVLVLLREGRIPAGQAQRQAGPGP